MKAMRVENTASLASSSIERGKNGTLFTVDTPTMGLLCCPEVDDDLTSSVRILRFLGIRVAKRSLEEGLNG
jgi:hypothetical protein